MSFKSFLLIIMLAPAFLSCSLAQAQKQKQYVVNGYVMGKNKIINSEVIDAKKLTHINYAFVNCIDSMAVLTYLKTDTVNFRKLNELKKINPNLKIMISIGGWNWSKNFSDAILTASSRALFARTSVDILRKYKLDGVDIDWEYPGQRGANNSFRPEDKQNYTLMFKAIRLELDKLSRETGGKKYQLTAAIGSKEFIEYTEMAEVGKILDYIWLMTYNYSGPNGTVGHHTHLYSDGGLGYSADRSIKNFVAAGVPINKIAMGSAFYSKSYVAESAENNGLGQKRGAIIPGVAGGDGPGYTFVKDSMINKNGYKRYWDNEAKAPYLFNAEKKIFVTYDDEQSIKEKSDYIKKNHLAGIFFWEYSNDPKKYLLTEIDKDLP